MIIQPSRILEIFKNHGLRASEQRIAIYRFLYHNRIHPNAIEIFEHLKTQHPSLSLTTIYNTMKIFEEYGLVTVLMTEENEQRYDINTDGHAHFICRKCGKLTDIFTERAATYSIPQGYILEKTQVTLQGLCAECSMK